MTIEEIRADIDQTIYQTTKGYAGTIMTADVIKEMKAEVVAAARKAYDSIPAVDRERYKLHPPEISFTFEDGVINCSFSIRPDLPVTFRDELRQLINKHSCENASDTPDFVLAEFLDRSLAAFDLATQMRDKWYKLPLSDKLDICDGPSFYTNETYMQQLRPQEQDSERSMNEISKELIERGVDPTDDSTGDPEYDRLADEPRNEPYKGDKG